MIRMKITLLLIFCFFLGVCNAQLTIRGTVKDQQTGQALPYTNIQIESTYRGTITNDDGLYTLQIKRLPATLIFRFIGYESKRITVTEQSSLVQNVFLKPTVIRLPAIVVTSEDPAVGIMTRVIKKKQEWRSRLESYRAKAYTRVGLENDTSIVSISESTSDVYWHHKKGVREVVRSRRETSNISSEMNFAFAGNVPNLYDDDVDTDDNMFVGPTHPEAHRYYHFKLLGERNLDDKTVVDIAVRPKSKLQPTFVGNLSVLLEEYAMIEIDVKTGEAILFPPPIEELNYHFKQQFSNFGKEFWLPVDCRIGANVRIGMTGLHFPEIKFNQISRLTDYEINIELPDSLYEKREIFQIDSVSVEKDTLLADEAQLIPLTVRESEAYASIDSTMTLRKAFRPTGFFARFINARADRREREERGEEQTSMIKWFSGIRPSFRYNRVDGFHLGLGYRRTIIKNLSLNFIGAYKTGLKRWAHGGELKYRFGKNRTIFINLKYINDTQVCVRSRNYPPIFTSIHSIFGSRDYFDYYWNQSLRGETGISFSRIPIRLSLHLRSENHTSVDKTTDWSLFKKDRVQRPNPVIDEGSLRSIGVDVVFGGEYIPWGVVGQNRLEIRAEHSSPDFFKSDFSFTRYEMALNGCIPTFLRRRLLPVSLDFQLVAGRAIGTLPIQRLYSMDGRLSALTPFGTFRSLDRPVEGDSYVGIFWEHHFRTVPFEMLGLRGLAKRGLGIILHGASGRTWLSYQRRSDFTKDLQCMDSWQHEIGLSLNGVLNFFRVDVIKRLNEPGIFLGVSAARLF